MAGRQQRQIKLGMFLRPAGHHIAAWRHPEAQADGGVNFAHYTEVAREAERGLFDMLFSADAVTAMRHDLAGMKRMSYVAWIDPYTLLAGLAAVTSRVGLVCTATTTYNEPYTLARQFASLDILSNGRAGWNLVTSSNASEAVNFGRDQHMAKAERYRRAREFAQVVRGLWDSWDDDAFVRDCESGLFFHPEKLHALNHDGRYFKVAGPLNVPRPPQGHPVVVQAGASDEGRELAAETADVIFCAHANIGAARDFYADVKSRMGKYGRDPDSLKVMPGMFIVVGRTRQEARDKLERMHDLVHTEVGVSLVSKYLGFDLTGYDVDGPIPDVPYNAGANTRVELVKQLARQDGPTIRQLWRRMAGGRGHYQMHGSPAEVADVLEEWFTSNAADGFNFLPPILPGGLTDFVDLVVPELQRRGVYRTAYAGKTLRENLGLSRPASRYAMQA
jgi:FMN-dependent oxidoreductase (nitrilotriacetate monooxygenase family)